MANPIQTATTSNFGASSDTCSFSGLPSATHQVIACITLRVSGGSWQQVTGVTDNQGNTYVRAFGYFGPGNQTVENMEYWWCSSIGTPSGTFTITVNYTAATASDAIVLMECSGLAWVDQTSSNLILLDAVPGQGTSLTMTNMVADVGSSDFMISSVYLDASGSALGITTPGGWTSQVLQDPGNPDYSIATKTQTSNAAPDTVTWTWTTSGSAIGTLVSFSATKPTQPHIVNVPPMFWSQGIASPAVSSTTMYGVQSGNTILVAVNYKDDNTTFNAPATVNDGSSYTQDIWEPTSGHSGCGVYSLWNTSAGNHTINISSTSASYEVVGSSMEVWGLPLANSLDVTGAATGTSTGPFTATSSTLTNAGDLVVAIAMYENYVSLATPAGWLSTMTSTDGAGAVQAQPAAKIAALLPGATTALSPSFGTQGSSARWAVAIAAYKPFQILPANLLGQICL